MEGVRLVWILSKGIARELVN